MNRNLREAIKIATKIYKSNNRTAFDDYIGKTKWQQCCIAAFNDNKWRDMHHGQLSIIMKIFFDYIVESNDYEYKKEKLFGLIDRYTKKNSILENE